MAVSLDDYRHMAKALQLAERGRYTVAPNPIVGCVLTLKGEVVAKGWHYRAGERHAEIHALQQCSNPKGATAYVTLEPCSHQGRTGACAKALIAQGVARVVYGMTDPNPEVAGRGLAMLQQAGVTVDGPVLERQARALNPGFISRMCHQRPYVRCKIASSLDGRTALANGQSQWITGSAARADVQRLRAASCAIITGIGSILHDNSRLSLRPSQLRLENIEDVLQRPPLRVILDTHLRIPIDAALFDAPGPILIVTGEVDANAAKVLSTRYSHVTVIRGTLHNKRIDLGALLQQLGQRYQCNNVLLEAGATLVGAFAQAGLIDEWLIYQAPVLMGSKGKPLAELAIDRMTDKLTFNIIDRRQFGDDTRLTAVVRPSKVE